MTSLEEKVNCILDAVSSDFNSLPYEERKRINRFISYMQILTLSQILDTDRDLTNQMWRSKQRKRLESCVERHLKEWGYV